MENATEKLDPGHTALVLIDLQKGITPFAGGPHSAAEVLQRAGTLAARFRALRAPVVLVRVGWSKDFGDALKQPVDRPAPTPPGGLPANWWEPADELAVSDGDIQIIKLGGISTNIGVESTARAAWEHGYALVLAEDAMSAANAEQHQFAVDTIFPRLGRVRSTAAILDMLN
jgi:nicotinamidase-related amidase